METPEIFRLRTVQDTGTVGRARGRDLGGHSPSAQRRAGLTGVHLQLESLVDHLELMGFGTVRVLIPDLIPSFPGEIE